MSRRTLWRILLPLVITANLTIFYILITGSSTDTEPQVIRIESPVAYKPVFIPDTVTFADESVPMDRFDTRESLDRELLVNSYFHSQTLRLIKMAPQIGRAH